MIKLIFTKYFLWILVVLMAAGAYLGRNWIDNWFHDKPISQNRSRLFSTLSRRDKIVLIVLFVWLAILIAVLAYYS